MKSIILDQYNYRIPVWAIPALVNADCSALTEDEERHIDEFEGRLNSHVKENKGTHYTFSIDYGKEEPYFSMVNAFNNVGDDVLDCTIYIFGEE